LDKFDEITSTEESVRSEGPHTTSSNKRTFKSLIGDNFDGYLNKIRNVSF